MSYRTPPTGSVYWARCDHLAALPALEDPFNAWQTETWPFKVSLHYQNKALFAFNCAFNAHRCHENMYRVRDLFLFVCCFFCGR